MKRICTLFLSLMITFNAISVFAISKTELESNPERYIIISESTDGNGYCDYSNTKVIANTDTTATIKTKIYQVFNTKQMITTCDYDFIYNKERSTKNLTELVMSKPEARAMPEYFVNQLKALDSGVKVHKYNFKVFNFSGKDITPLNLHGYEKTMTADMRSLDYSIASGLYGVYFDMELF